MAPPVTGDDNGVGYGVSGNSAAPHNGTGVAGVAALGDGVFGKTQGVHGAGVHGVHSGHFNGIAVLGELPIGVTAVMGKHSGGSNFGGNDPTGSGVWGDSASGPGVAGTSSAAEGVFGAGVSFGVQGSSTNGIGVRGENVGGISNPKMDSGAGVSGVSQNGDGVHGETNAPEFAAGVHGVSLNPKSVAPGVWGNGVFSPGVLGTSSTGTGVQGFQGNPHTEETIIPNKCGVFGAAEAGAGILGYSWDPDFPAVLAFGGIKSFAQGHQLSGEFDGKVKVFGDLEVSGDVKAYDVVLAGADCAEQFDVVEGHDAEPGTVVVLEQGGAIRESRVAYDKRVAGIISGAGTFRPGIVLDQRVSSGRRVPIALVGKVFCKVDAQYSPIEVGDLLTSSPTPGHAMKACDPLMAFGAVIGKALFPVHYGQALIPVLVALQ